MVNLAGNSFTKAFLHQTIGYLLIMVTTVVFQPIYYHHSKLVRAKDFSSAAERSAALSAAFKSSSSSSSSLSLSSSATSTVINGVVVGGGVGGGHHQDTSLDNSLGPVILQQQQQQPPLLPSQQTSSSSSSLITGQNIQDSFLLSSIEDQSKLSIKQIEKRQPKNESKKLTKKPKSEQQQRLRSFPAFLQADLSPLELDDTIFDTVGGGGGGDPRFDAMIAIDPNDPCYNFTVGNLKYQEFFSPNYPNNYPNDTECERVIQAPHGYQISIEFRDQFSLEDSPNCAYDYLEIRDGAYGYSSPLAKLCGPDFPRDIISNDRYLFLRFVSDDSIEYQGFRAVYSFIKMTNERPEPPDECRFNKTGVSGTIENRDIPLELTNYSVTQNVPIDCMWNITVAAGYKMYLNFKEYKLTSPNNCEANYIDIYGEKLSDLARKQRFCGTQAEPVRSDDNHMNIRFFAKPDALSNVQFEITFTAFRELSNKAETCRPDEFDCEDSTCIDIGLKCDGVDNCKYRYDEDKQTTCAPGNKGVLNLNSQHMVVILIVFCALVFGMCASIAISCWSKIEERSQRKREYKLRRSREASMEVGLDRTMTITSLDRSCPLEHGEQTSSSSGSRCRKIVTANAIRQKPDIGVDDDDIPQMGYYDSEENGCYVPDLDIAPMHHHSSTAHHHLVYPSSNERRPKQMQTVQPNGGTICTSHHLDPVDKYSPDTPTPPQMMIGSPNTRGHIGGTQSPLVGDHYYHQQQQQQQQQQLQQNIERDSIRSSSDCSIPPPPPPPSLSHFRNRLQQQQQQPQQYRTLPLDPSKLTDASMLIMSDNHHQSVQYRHPQHTSRIITTSGGGGGQPSMLIHPQHHPDCAQHQLNKMQQTSMEHQSQYNPNSLRRGGGGGTYYTNQPTPGNIGGGGGGGNVRTQQTSGNSNPGSQRPSPMPIGSNGDTNELLNDVIDVDGCIDEGDESGVGPSEQRSAMELNDDIIDDDVLTENDIFPSSNGPASASGRHQSSTHYLLRGQSTLEEEDDSSVPLNSTNSNTGYGSGQQQQQQQQQTNIGQRQVYYRSEAVIEMVPRQDTNRQDVALIR
uniref:Uncharacterized protein LOC113797486 isoform X1 n=1 Tax=Dermatophagoides pteronyssinus TaxID=6956 RepID=A0A6P6YEH7_DERPT|nr:uncharacterized protein LOC113797486 isoform X1 [Dermatophagoides pteronyssinus]